MKTLITSALFIAQFMINGSFAQEMASATNEALAQRIAEDVCEEIGLADSSAFQLVCRLTERNQGMAGTGAALVMYAPARVHLSVEFNLVDRTTGKTLWTGVVYATGRTSMAEALENVVERGAVRVADAVDTQPVLSPVNVVAQEH